MLFHAIHRHTHETCSAHKPENRALFAKAFASANDIGVKIIGSYADAPGHTLFMIIEADTALQIAKFFDPILDLGDTEIKPVTSTVELLDQMQKLEK